MKQTITIQRFGYTRLCRGSKRAVAHYGFDSKGRQVIKVSYFDEAFNHRTYNTGCCQPPTTAYTEAGAIRAIRKFFNS